MEEGREESSISNQGRSKHTDWGRRIKCLEKLALRVPPAVTRLTVYCWLHILTMLTAIDLSRWVVACLFWLEALFWKRREGCDALSFHRIMKITNSSQFWESTWMIHDHLMSLYDTKKTSDCHVNVSEWFLLFSISHDFSLWPEMAIGHHCLAVSDSALWCKTKFIQFLVPMVRQFWNVDPNMTHLPALNRQKNSILSGVACSPHRP